MARPPWEHILLLLSKKPSTAPPRPHTPSPFPPEQPQATGYRLPDALVTPITGQSPPKSVSSKGESRSLGLRWFRRVLTSCLGHIPNPRAKVQGLRLPHLPRRRRHDR